MMMTSDFSTSHTLVSLDYLRQVGSIDSEFQPTGRRVLVYGPTMEPAEVTPFRMSNFDVFAVKVGDKVVLVASYDKSFFLVYKQ